MTAELKFAPKLSEHRLRAETEFDEYYSAFDPYTQPLLVLLNQMLKENPTASAYELKTQMYELLCCKCPVHLFRETDFFFEISSGRGRHTWGGLQSPIGSFLHEGSRRSWLAEYEQSIAEDVREGFFFGWSPVGFDHHCAGYEKILKLGLSGIIEQTREKLKHCDDIRKQEFYSCVIRANKALINLAHRFAEEASRLKATANSDAEVTHYDKIYKAASRVPEHPAESFYEALCAIFFYRECVGSLEGIGISTFGLLDRMLYPYYQADLQNGRITHDEALRLLSDLLSYTEIRFETGKLYAETSTTIELGGFDRDGNVIFNTVTELILDAVINVRSIDTKINCRISKQHPIEFLRKIVAIQLENLPCVMLHNDDVLIPARVKCGQNIEDARMYVGCGCHEIVLSGSEVCTRADSWINLPRILLDTMSQNENWNSFESFYQHFLRDVEEYHKSIALRKNRGEAQWCEYDPLILYSSSIEGSIEKGLDITEGGAKYNSTSLSMLGTATLIDSLYAIRQLVFIEQRLSITEYYKILQQNFDQNESLRQYIINKLPKHGTNNSALNSFSGKVLHDLSHVSGQDNARGGKYLPAFYAHDIYRSLGFVTGATPDGRMANTPLSRGVSPSEFIETNNPLDLIHSLKAIDFTDFTDSFITEMTLPAMENTEKSIQVLTAIIKGFLEAEGSSLQFNLIDRQTLLEAKNVPELHRNLVVRVCGYSALFVTLNKETQDEIIARAVR